jgi:uncharacterized membrane protein SirB2
MLMKRYSRRIAVFMAVFSFVALYVVAGFLVSVRYPKTSDQAGYFIAGHQLAQGDVLLRNWILTAPDFWTSDIPLSALLSFFWKIAGHPGISPLLLQIQPVLMWTALVLSGLWFVFHYVASVRGRVGGALVIMASLGVPLLRSPIAYFVTLSAIHMGSILYAVWAFYFSDRFLKSSRPVDLFLTFLLLFLGTIGDPLLLVIGILPLFIYGFLSAIRFCKATWLREVALAAGSLSAAGGASLVLVLVQRSGGFIREQLQPHFVQWDDLGRNISVSLHGVFLVFGATPFGRIPSDAIPEIVRTLLLCVCAFSVIGVFIRTSGERKRSSRGCVFLCLLLMASGLDFLSLILSDRLSFEMNGLAGARYLFPLWVCLTFVAALLVGKRWAVMALAGAVLFTSVPADIATLRSLPVGMLRYYDVPLLKDLMATESGAIGVGSWWTSLNLEAASGGRLRVLPGISDSSGRIVPLVHIHEGFDFDELKHRKFFVLLPDRTPTYGEKDVLGTFGPPLSRIRSGENTVFFYDMSKQHHKGE